MMKKSLFIIPILFVIYLLNLSSGFAGLEGKRSLEEVESNDSKKQKIEESKAICLNSIPNDMKTHILSYLGLRDLIRLSQLSKSWKLGMSQGRLAESVWK